MIPHWPIHDTALAAALATLGIELDPGQPYTCVVDTETGAKRATFLFRDRSATEETRRTDALIADWQNPQHPSERPEHPMNAMRAAIAARAELIKIVKGNLPAPCLAYAGEKLQTPHLSEAVLLRACGLPLLLFTGRAFAFPARWNGTDSAQHLATAQKTHGQTREQWISRFLANFSQLLTIAKHAPPTLKTTEDSRTLLLSADAPKKLRDKFTDAFTS